MNEFVSQSTNKSSQGLITQVPQKLLTIRGGTYPEPTLIRQVIGAQNPTRDT